MTTWRDVEQGEPEFARRVRALFDARRHKTIATLRADGSPRISGIEAVFEEGELGPDGDRFHADIAEVVHTHLNEEATMLVVRWWTPTHGLRTLERA
ncbi:MAG: hypothetical protein ABSH51_20645 [Solirubrobacteraceae bacterium]|jgi:hypothetical protein